jgi:hypothetical protein
MLIVRIIGGLGNQMFQYAAGRALAAKYGVPLKLDLRWMQGYHHRYFLLDKFPILVETPSWKERLKFTWFPFRRRPFFFYSKIIRRFNHLLYIEPSFSYNPAFWNLGPEIFLFGYFQSPKYFGEYELLIRKDFTYSVNEYLYSKEILDAIHTKGSTALHIRRGDYVKHKATSCSIGICNLDYYIRAVKYLEQIIKVRLIVFSDDIEWCKQNVKFNNTIFVEQQYNSPLDDMFLAAQCENMIISNSTFAWWCAWLNPHPTKIVVAPKQWFKNEEMNNKTYDLISQKWVRL